MSMPAVVWLLLACAVVVTYYIARSLRSKVNDVRGPSSSHFFLGNMGDIINQNPDVAKWTEQYGRVFRYQGVLKVRPTMFFRSLMH